MSSIRSLVVGVMLMACDGQPAKSSMPGGSGNSGTTAGSAGEATAGAKSDVGSLGGSAAGGSASGGKSGAGSGGSAAGSGGSAGVADLPTASDTVVYLSDLTPKDAVAFDAPGAPARAKPAFGNDKSLSGKPLVIDNLEYAKGIEARAYTQIWYTIEGKYTHFIAETGLDYLEDSTATGFEVGLDGKLVYDTGNVDKQDVKHIDIDVTGVKELYLYTRTHQDNSVDKDFGIWGGARLTK